LSIYILFVGNLQLFVGKVHIVASAATVAARVALMNENSYNAAYVIITSATSLMPIVTG